VQVIELKRAPLDLADVLHAAADASKPLASDRTGTVPTPPASITI
jgi:hypothetical protein